MYSPVSEEIITGGASCPKRDFFVDNLLVRILFIIDSEGDREIDR